MKLAAWLLSLLWLAGFGTTGPPVSQHPATQQAVAGVVHLPELARDGPRPAGVHYEVQPGDNLWAIALRFGTQAATLISLNGLRHANDIAPGRSILVLADGPAPTPPLRSASAQLVTRGGLSQLVAFSFDAGSDRGYAGVILDTLAANGITASFGVTGAWADQNPDLLRRIVAGGHHIINHSYSHPDFTTLSTARRREELDRAEASIVAITGLGTKPYFRPPFGAYNGAVNEDLAADGYSLNILWTVDSLGWNGLSASQIVSRCLSGAVPGGIFLFHVGSQSEDGPALQALIDGLRAKGYAIGSVPDVLGQ